MERQSPSQEKRRFKRASVPGIKISYKLLDPRTLSTYQERILETASDISLGGVGLSTANELAPKAPVGVDIKINPEQ